MMPDGLSFLAVYSDDDGFARVPLCEEGKLDAMVTEYLDSGGTRDKLIHLDTLDGVRYVVRASSVTSWYVSTPEGRARQNEINAALKAESAPWDNGE